MSIDYDLFVIRSDNMDTTNSQLRDCIADAIENLKQRIEKLEKNNEEWETVEDPQPKEPLVKDEKIRKAVRAWAEANEDIESVVYDSKSRELHEVGCDRAITLWGLSKEREPQLLHKEIYTITELCGEEE